MAVKASDTITIYKLREIIKKTTYYLIQSSTANPPATPIYDDPGSGWQTTEPNYDSSETLTLYTTEKITYSDVNNPNSLLDDQYYLTTSEPNDWSNSYNEYYTKLNGDYILVTDSTAPTWVANTYYHPWNFSYSPVSKVTAFEAAKEAYNLADQANERADQAWTKADTAQNDIDNMAAGQHIQFNEYMNQTYKTNVQFESDMIDNNSELKKQWEVTIDKAVENGNDAYDYICKKLRPYIRQSLDLQFNKITSSNAPSDWATRYYKDYYMLNPDNPFANEDEDMILVPKGTTAPTWEANKYYSATYKYYLTEIQPSDWTTNWTDYYIYNNGVYTHVTGSTAPTWAANTYYQAIVKPVLTLSAGTQTCKLIITNDTIEMRNYDGTTLTNWNVNDMNVNNVNANNTLKIGKFAWVNNSDGSLSLKKIS